MQTELLIRRFLEAENDDCMEIAIINKKGVAVSVIGI